MKGFGFFLRVAVASTFYVLTRSERVSYENCTVYQVREAGVDKPALRVAVGKDRPRVLSEHRTIDEESTPHTVRSYLVCASEEKLFVSALKAAGADFKVSIQNLEERIQKERRTLLRSERRSSSEPGIRFDSYYSYEEIVKYIKYLTWFKNPVNQEPLVVVDNIGKTYEGRDMYLVKISTSHSEKKPLVFFEAGIHAREWTAPATALYMMNQLVQNYTAHQDLLNKIDFYIIPVSNPDGYEYSRSADRLWRKTRSLYENHYGTDGNRNFGYHWGERGTSDDPESPIFKGPYAFSEVETRNIRDTGKKYVNRIKAFVSIHAYGPTIVYPWSYAITDPAPHSEDLERIGKAAAVAIKKFSGTVYKVGVSSLLMYEAAGGSDDYFKGVLGVDLAFTFEVSSAGEMSFIVPTSKVFGIVSEAFEGLKVIALLASDYKGDSEPKEEVYQDTY